MATEGLDWLAAALAAAGPDAPLENRARALRGQVFLFVYKGALYDAEGLRKPSRAAAAEALTLSRKAGDDAGVAEALLALGFHEASESFPQVRRRELAEEALAHARAARDDRLEATALAERALALPPSEATVEFAQAEAALLKLGSSRLLVGLYNNAAYNAIKEDRPELARPFLARAVPVLRKLGDPSYEIMQQGNLGLEALLTGSVDRAEAAFREQLRLCREHAIVHLASEGLGGMAAIAAHRGDAVRAAQLLGAAAAIGPIADDDVTDRLEPFFSAARKRLGEGEWLDAEARGRTCGFDEAIEFALDEALDGAVHGLTR
jgi:tetratricopeptide (TPR) repeat protein